MTKTGTTEMTQCGQCGQGLGADDEGCGSCGAAVPGWDSAEGLRVYEDWLKEFAADGVLEDWEHQELGRLRLEQRIRLSTHDALQKKYQPLAEALPMELEIDGSTVREFVVGTAGQIRARVRNCGDRPVRNTRVRHAVPGVAEMREHVSRMLGPNRDEVFTIAVECSRAGQFSLEAVICSEHVGGTMRYRADPLGFTVGREASAGPQSVSVTNHVDASGMRVSGDPLVNIAGFDRSGAATAGSFHTEARWVKVRLQPVSEEEWSGWESRHDGGRRQAAEEAARAEESAAKARAEAESARRAERESQREAEAARESARSEAEQRRQADLQSRADELARGQMAEAAMRTQLAAAEARAKVAEAARQQAEADARAMAAAATERANDEARARARAEKENRKRAEAENRSRAEAENTKRTEAESRSRAEAENRKRTEAENRSRAENARQQAEVAARLKQEADERQRAARVPTVAPIVALSSGYPMRPVPAQTFAMGLAGYKRNPAHQVTLSRSYLIGVYPVTQALWTRVMGKNPSSVKMDEGPVTDISWFDACEFANKLSELDGLTAAYAKKGFFWTEYILKLGANGYRLPTEAEWECAARAGTSLEYSGSNSLDEVGWFDGNSGGRSHKVGEKRANGYGLHDLSGNVWEWCWDWYGDLGPVSATDPTGANAAACRVYRGGSWRAGAGDARVAFRDVVDPTCARVCLGVRLVRST